jgi:hypothetical protein
MADSEMDFGDPNDARSEASAATREPESPGPGPGPRPEHGFGPQPERGPENAISKDAPIYTTYAPVPVPKPTLLPSYDAEMDD